MMCPVSRPPPRTTAMLIVCLGAASGAGCAWLQPPPPPTCAAPCADILHVLAGSSDEASELAVRMKVVPGTRLHNANLTSASAPACSGGVAVSAVKVDERRYAEGPATLAEHSEVWLTFPP